jgi:hypothetical protein
MGTQVKEPESKEFQLPSAGLHFAICFNEIDLGLQKVVTADGEKIMGKVIIGWEIDETIPDGDYKGKRFCIWKKYTKSLHSKSNLKKDLESWRGRAFTDDEKKGFDLDNVVNKGCMLNVVHTVYNGKTYANIASISPLMKNAIPMKPENDRKIPKWIQTIIDNQVAQEKHDEIKKEIVDDDGTPF